MALTRIEGVVDDLDLTDKHIRSAIFGLETDRLTATGMRDQVRLVCQDSAEMLGFEPVCIFDGPVDTAINEALATELLATLREALSNVVRHANASSVAVEVTVTRTVSLQVVDDGSGPPDRQTSSGPGTQEHGGPSGPSRRGVLPHRRPPGGIRGLVARALRLTSARRRSRSVRESTAGEYLGGDGDEGVGVGSRPAVGRLLLRPGGIAGVGDLGGDARHGDAPTGVRGLVDVVDLEGHDCVVKSIVEAPTSSGANEYPFVREVEVDRENVGQGAGGERDPSERLLRQQPEALCSFQYLEAVAVEFHDQR